jgi:hypothetical protein
MARRIKINWGYWLALGLLLSLMLAATGCMKSIKEVPVVDGRGNPVLGQDGKLLTVKQELTNETAYGDQQVDLKKHAISHQKPQVAITLAPGASLKAEGGEVKIESFVQLPKEAITVVEYQGDVAKVLIAGKEYLMPISILYALGWGPNYGRGPAGTQNYNLTTQGDNSPATVTGGNMGDFSVAPSTTTTTTSNDDHSVQGAQ